MRIKDIYKPPKTQRTVYLSPARQEQITRMATAYCRPPAVLIRECIEESIDKIDERYRQRVKNARAKAAQAMKVDATKVAPPTSEGVQARSNEVTTPPD